MTFSKKTYRLWLYLFLSIYSTSVCSSNISDYQRTYIPLHTSDGTLEIAIRVFKKNNVPSFLMVNTNNLKTRVVAISEISFRDRNNNRFGNYTQKQIENSNYYQLLQKYSTEPYVLENYGITHAKPGVTGNILTIDMCQSSIPYEKDFFDKLATLPTEKPIPIAIAISGLWLLMHQEEFEHLLSLQQNKKLDITWVNHSFSHPYYGDLPYSKNFLLSENVNIKNEILLPEQYLLEADQTPSVFFRFPGLVSDKKLIMKIKQFGLLPLGADAWIANNQPITRGGIILVHGNGNEHRGIIKLIPKLDQLELVDLNENI